MKNCSAENLYANYTQMAHHGHNGVSEEFYQYIKPQRCFWATPEWLWNNDTVRCMLWEYTTCVVCSFAHKI